MAPFNSSDFSSRLTRSFSIDEFFFLRRVSQRRKNSQKEKLTWEVFKSAFIPVQAMAPFNPAHASTPFKLTAT